MRYLIALTLSVYMTFQPAFAALNEVDKTNIFSKNMLKNGGFENGKASWTASAGTFAVTTSSPMMGLQHATWDAAASADTLTSGDITIPAGYFGRNGVGSCVFTTASGTATHEIQIWDGASILSEATITSSTTPTRTSVNFIYPSSASVAVRIYANADEPSIAIDDCYLGPAEGYNVSSVSQATFVGGMENDGASTCSYTQNTSSGVSNFVDLGTGTSCAAWTVTSNGPGTISAQGTNDHRLVYTNMPPGHYQFLITGVLGNLSAANATWYFRLSDGTNTYQPQGSGGSANALTQGLLVFHVPVTTTATRTYKLQVADNAAITSGWYNAANNPGAWKVYRFPTSSEQAYTPDLQAMSWSGYHDSTCSWARTNTAYGDPTADASCALTQLTNQNFGTVSTTGSVLPGISFTPKKAGRYYACAGLSSVYGSTVSTVKAQLLDDSTTIAQQAFSSAAASYIGSMQLCGVVVATSTASKTLKIQTAVDTGTVTMTATSPNTYTITWTIFSLDQSIPAPVLTNMVTTSSSGGVRIESARASSTCSSTPCALASSTAGISSVSRSGAGDYTINFVSGTFSTTPTCVITPGDVSGVGDVRLTSISSTTAKSFATFNNAGTLTDTSFDILCMGQR